MLNLFFAIKKTNQHNNKNQKEAENAHLEQYRLFYNAASVLNDLRCFPDFNLIASLLWG